MVIKISEITTRADEVIEISGSRDPYDIAEALGITIIDRSFEKQLGVFLIIENTPFIFVKDNLDETLKRIVILHEIGHFILHRNKETNLHFIDSNLFGINNRMEYEANYFAAHISLPDDEFFELIKYGYNADQIARALKSNSNLVALKVNLLNKRGYRFKCPYFQSKFLSV